MIRQQANLLTPIIPANGILALNVPGRYCYLVDAASRIGMRIGDQPESLFAPGSGVAFPEGSDFERVELRNPTGAAQQVSVWVGYSEFVDRRIALIEPETELVAWSGTQIGAASGVTFPPVLTTPRVRRKALLIDNQDPALPLHVRDVAGNVAFHVRAETTITVPASGIVEVFNPAGAPVACSVCEIYWVQ